MSHYLGNDKNVASVVEQKIKVFALGGLDENGKNLYVVEVNDKIFILDAGLKYPTEDLLGVDAVIPDFTYLKENASYLINLKNPTKKIYEDFYHKISIDSINKFILIVKRLGFN